MHRNLRSPEPRRSFPALITTPCQVWSSWTYTLPYCFWCWYITLRCDLDLWPCDVNLDIWPWANRIIRGWVIDDLAHFRCTNLRVGHFYRTVLRSAWTQLHQTWHRHGDHFYRRNLFQSSDILLHFKRGRLKVEWCWKWPPVKMMEGWARSLNQLLKFTYDRTSGTHLIAVLCAAAERDVLIKRQKKVHQ